MNYYLEAFKKYAEFERRAHRAEYWYFVLVSFIISIVLVIIFGAGSSLGNIYSLVVLIPSLSVGTRRLHDIGKSGWMLLVALIPLAGWIWIIVLLASEGDSGDNQYGPNPKSIVAVPTPIDNNQASGQVEPSQSEAQLAQPAEPVAVQDEVLTKEPKV